jgi:hypothetical protein
MSCEECEEIQKKAFDKNDPESCPIAYIRIDTGNVAIVGCDKHLVMMVQKIKRQ